MKKVQLIILGAGVILGTTLFTACGGNKTVEAKDAQEVAVGTGDAVYIVNNEESTIVWTGKKSLVESSHTGTINATEGTITVDGGVITAGKFVLDMNTIVSTDVTDADMNGKLVGHLKSADFFDVEVHPTATFEITSASKLEEVDSLNNNYKIAGNLTIKGVAKNIEFPANVTIENGVLTAKADFAIDRTQWEVKYGSGTVFSDLGDKAISDAIEFNITLKANAQTQEAATTENHEGHAH